MTSDSVLTVHEGWHIASGVTDPEMPMLTLADLGVLRDVAVDHRGAVAVTITPTYSGCPAMQTMRDDLVRVLTEHGARDVEVRIRLRPVWTSDWITKRGRATLRAHGISPPGNAPQGPLPLTLSLTRRAVWCPRCDSGRTERVSEFGGTACKAIYRCLDCLEQFDHVKEI